MAAAMVVFHRLAAREYRAARDWYRKRSESVAGRFRDAIDHAVSRVAKDPAALPLLIKQYRYVRVPRFPYILVFRQLAPENVMILAVAHTSRRPGHWRRRK
jgi:plasmid stabilization system protein ParE